MSFYKEVRTFFLKNDPGRVRLAKKIATNFKTKSAQKTVIKRLVEVYKNGGPSNIKIIPSIPETPQVSDSLEEE